MFQRWVIPAENECGKKWWVGTYSWVLTGGHDGGGHIKRSDEGGHLNEAWLYMGLRGHIKSSEGGSYKEQRQGWHVKSSEGGSPSSGLISLDNALPSKNSESNSCTFGILSNDETKQTRDRMDEKGRRDRGGTRTSMRVRGRLTMRPVKLSLPWEFEMGSKDIKRVWMRIRLSWLK